MTGHTPGPWSAVDERDGGTLAFRIASAKGTDAVAHVVGYADVEGNDPTTEANAARIVQCVNACEGIEDPAAVLAEVRALLRAIVRNPGNRYGVENYAEQALTILDTRKST